MDFGTFDGFWHRLARTRLHMPEVSDLEAVLGQAMGAWRSCVVCNLLWERAFDLTSRWQQLLASDAAAQADFLCGQTWCNRHAWFFSQMMAPVSQARLQRRLHEEVAARIREHLQSIPERPMGGDARTILESLIGRRTCPLCDDESALLTLVLAAIVRGLTAGSLRPAFAASAGCCLPHLAALLSRVAHSDTARFLLEATQDRLARLTAELDYYQAESESRRRRYESAADAPARALAAWAGLRDMVRDWEGTPTESRPQPEGVTP